MVSVVPKMLRVPKVNAVPKMPIATMVFMVSMVFIVLRVHAVPQVPMVHKIVWCLWCFKCLWCMSRWCHPHGAKVNVDIMVRLTNEKWISWEEINNLMNTSCKPIGKRRWMWKPIVQCTNVSWEQMQIWNSRNIWTLDPDIKETLWSPQPDLVLSYSSGREWCPTSIRLNGHGDQRGLPFIATIMFSDSWPQG